MFYHERSKSQALRQHNLFELLLRHCTTTPTLSVVESIGIGSILWLTYPYFHYLYKRIYAYDDTDNNDGTYPNGQQQQQSKTDSKQLAKKKKNWIYSICSTYLVEFFYQELNLLFCSHHKDEKYALQYERVKAHAQHTDTHHTPLTFILSHTLAVGHAIPYPFRIYWCFWHTWHDLRFSTSVIFIIVIHQHYTALLWNAFVFRMKTAENMVPFGILVPSHSMN